MTAMRILSILKAPRRSPVALVFVAALLASAPAFAHHSFTMFDMGKEVTVSGTVTSFEWTNPHAYIEIDVADEGGAVKHLSIELGSPSILQRVGWKAGSLKAGDKSTLVINPLKDGRAGGFLVQATLPGGQVLTNGPRRPPQP